MGQGPPDGRSFRMQNLPLLASRVCRGSAEGLRAPQASHLDTWLIREVATRHVPQAWVSYGLTDTSILGREVRWGGEAGVAVSLHRESSTQMSSEASVIPAKSASATLPGC